MRVFLMILIFAIGFSGYMAAGHAFADTSCDTLMKTMTVDAGADVSDCVDHQKNDSSKTKCIDCMHHCVSHALTPSGYSVSLPPLAATLNVPPTHGYVDSYPSSLLRPPKSLI